VDATLGEGAAVSLITGISRSRPEDPRVDRQNTAPGRAHVIYVAKRVVVNK
jgi:hypothetical protein